MSVTKDKALKTASKYVQQGKYQAAIEEYRKIIQADPQDTSTLNILGDIYVKIGNTAGAIQTFVRIADHYRNTNSHLKAIAMLKKAGKLDPANVEIALKLAALYAQQNFVAEARHQYMLVAEHYLRTGQKEQALSLYHKLAEFDPENTNVQLKLAETYLRDQQLDQAYDAFFAAAGELQKQGKHEEALKVYLKALKTKPDGRLALSAAVNLYIQRGETQPAESLIKNLLKRRPEDPDLLSLLGRVHQVAYDLASAKQAIAQAVEHDSTCFQYQVDLVSVSDRAYATFVAAASELQRQGKQEEALKVYLKALNIKPDSLSAAATIVDIYLERGETQDAVMLIRHLLRMRPDQAELLSLLGRVYREARDLDAAEQTIARAVLLSPSCFHHLLDLAYFFTRSGDLDRALLQFDRISDILQHRGEEAQGIALLHEVIARDANHLGALERLAFIHSRLGDQGNLIETLNSLAHAAIYKDEKEVAITVLQQLVQLEPEEVWHRRRLHTLCSRPEEGQQPESPSVTEAAPHPETAMSLSPSASDTQVTAASPVAIWEDGQVTEFEIMVEASAFPVAAQEPAEKGLQEFAEPIVVQALPHADEPMASSQPLAEVDDLPAQPAADLDDSSTIRFEMQPRVLSYIAWLGRNRLSHRRRRFAVLAHAIRTQGKATSRHRPERWGR